MIDEPVSDSKRRSGWRQIREWLVVIVTAVVIATALRTFVVQQFYIAGPSMETTLFGDDRVLVNKLAYRLGKPSRGDVIVFKVPTDNKTDYIKRLIGLPGDTIRMESGRLFIDGQMVEREKVDMYSDPDDGGIIQQTRFRETLPGGKVHFILEDTDNGPYDKIGRAHV